MQSRCSLARMTGMLLALMLPSAASAVRLEYLVELGIENNDNLNLTETDPESANILEPMLAFVATQEGSTVQASANGGVQYRDYLGGEFSDEFRGQLAGHLNWTMVPERLNLTVEDYLGVQPINALEPNTPNNQQQTNVFAIGPTLNFRIGPTVRGEAELRYINSYADETEDFNTNRLTAALRADQGSRRVEHDLREHHRRARRLHRKQLLQPDYSRYNVYGRYTRKWTKVDFVGDLGYSWLKYSDTLQDRDSPLARGALTWHYSERSTFGLDFAYQYSDAATDMMTGADITTIPTNIATGEATTTSQPVPRAPFRRKLLSTVASASASMSRRTIASSTTRKRALPTCRRTSCRTRPARAHRSASATCFARCSASASTRTARTSTTTASIAWTTPGWSRRSCASNGRATGVGACNTAITSGTAPSLGRAPIRMSFISASPTRVDQRPLTWRRERGAPARAMPFPF